MNRIRVAALQYFIRPVARFEQFAEQVTALVRSAQDYDARLLVFPEYFTCQLLTLSNNLSRPIREQIRHLATLEDRIVELMGGLSRDSGIYIVGGTLPAMDPPDDVSVYNESYLFSPNGEWDIQGKLHMTPWERDEWEISPHKKFKVFETEIGRMAVTICYDVEFPELARAAARQGAQLLIVPSCTDERQGYLRVRYCAQARAIENQMYVLQACTVGSLPQVPAVSLNYGQAALLTPSDFPFARDGILAEGNINQEMMVIGELNLDTIRETRQDGSVLPLTDSVTTDEVTSNLELVKL